MRPVHRPNHVYLPTPPTAQAPLLTQRTQSPDPAKLPPRETLDSIGVSGSSLDSLDISPVPELTSTQSGQQTLAAHFFAVIVTPTAATARYVPYPYPNAASHSSQPTHISSSPSAGRPASSMADINHTTDQAPAWPPLEPYPQIQLTPGRSLLLIARELPAHLPGIWCSGQHQDYLVYPQDMPLETVMGQFGAINSTPSYSYPVPTEHPNNTSYRRGKESAPNSQTSSGV